MQLAVKMGCTAAENDTLAALHVHIPPAQVSPAPQAFPQAPQFAVLVSVSTQTPLQSVPPPGQPHVPDTHDEPAGQVFPHAPQFEGSELVLMHAPSHAPVPAGHTHAPPTQDAPEGQALLHPPQ